jgi:hypothetical protein
VSEEEKELLWDMVQTGFSDLNAHSYDRQSMTREEFIEDTDSPYVLKYVARNKESRPIGYLSVHIGLEDINWTDTTQIAEVQEDIGPGAVPYYIGTLVIPLDERGTSTATLLLQGAARHFREANQKTGHDSLCFFDCAHQNYPWLAQFIEKAASEPAGEFEGVPIKITELFKEQIKKDPSGAALPLRVRVAPGAPDENILDAQHYYSIKMP